MCCLLTVSFFFTSVCGFIYVLSCIADVLLLFSILIQCLIKSYSINVNIQTIVMMAFGGTDYGSQGVLHNTVPIEDCSVQYIVTFTLAAVKSVLVS